MDKKTLRGKIDPLKIPKGHKPHRGGAGFHGDCRLKRENTRQARNSKAFRDWE